jgi:CubicO group peptidase (beta-lactamase class C family)
MTPTTRVGVASMSKQFAAAAMLQLEAEGRLSLRDTLGSFFAGVPADKSGITLQQLLTHTAGIRGGTTEDFDVPTLEASMQRLFALPLTGVPGSRWRYSSDAYGIIAAVIERVSGKAYGEYMHAMLFAPAGMVRTGLWPEAIATRDSVARAYTGWRDRGSPREWPVDWRVFGSGDVMTTATDLYRWDRALRAARVLNAATVAKYMSPQVALNGDPSDSYGYGLFVTQTKTRGKVVEHGGDTELGYNGAFFRYIDGDAVMIITSNASDFAQHSMRWYVQDDLEAMLFGSDTTKRPPPVRAIARTELVTLAGDYAVAGGVLHLVSDGAYLWVAAEGDSLVTLLRPMRASDDPSTFASASGRTAALLGRLEALDSSAYDAVLGDSAVSLRKEYVDEWSSLIATFGPLHGYRILGSVREGGTVVVYARLELRDGNETMSFRWSKLGAGRLSGTRPRPPARFPLVFAVARLGSSELVVHDLWLQHERAKLREIGGGRLRIEFAADSTRGRKAAVTAPVTRIGVLTP